MNLPIGSVFAPAGSAFSSMKRVFLLVSGEPSFRMESFFAAFYLALERENFVTELGLRVCLGAGSAGIVNKYGAAVKYPLGLR